MEKRQRISWFTAGAMIGVALLIDGIEALLELMFLGLILNTFLQLVAWVAFYLWFKFHGVNMLDGNMRKAIIYFGGGLLELVPLINTLPIWTLTVVSTILIVRRDDATYNRKVGQTPLPA